MTSPADLIRRVSLLPPAKRVEALRLIKSIALAQKADTKAANARDVAQRREYAGRPQAYIYDILGYQLVAQQEECLDAFERHDRVLVSSANNIGKTFILACYGAYRYDAVAALPDEEAGLEERGCKLLLPGPDHDTVFATVYAELITHAARAVSRGFPMPGEWSDRSVHWPVRPRWDVEAFSPRRDTKQDISHTASGRHHINQLALIEEGIGVEEPTWTAVEGMCSSDGNKVFSSFNPATAAGPVWTRIRAGTYHLITLDAFDHPNVRTRSVVVPAAISYKVIDDRVKKDCISRGNYPDVQPDPKHDDFVYAVPEPGMVGDGAREDGHLGHPSAPLRVYRPTPTSAFQAQCRGQFPRDTDFGLFNPMRWDEGVARNKAAGSRPDVPARVGCDLARTGGDEICCAPAWGTWDILNLLRNFAEIEDHGPEEIEAFRRAHRIVVGTIAVIPSGTGDEVAIRIAQRFPGTTYICDEGGVGTSPYDVLSRILKKPAVGISFGATAPPPPKGIDTWFENMRTAMYVLAAKGIELGLVDPPDDPLLREEIMAHSVIHQFKTVRVGGKRPYRAPSVILIPKDDIKKVIRRSPDRADAFVLSLTEQWMGRTPRITWLKRKRPS